MHTQPERVEPAPICGNCGSSMSDRQASGWFCPGCVAYDRNLPTIYPNSPEHPEFYIGIDEHHDRLVGREVEYSEYGQRETEYVGTITDVEPASENDAGIDWVEITHELDEPFDWTTRKIRLERFLELLHKVDHYPPGGGRIPEKMAFILL